MKIRTGFTSYLATKEYTADFIDDVNALILNVFLQWKLYDDEEEFNSSCWAKIAKALLIYDDDNSVGQTPSSLYTYLSSVVWNEARRIFSKHKKMVFDDITEYTEPVTLWSIPTSDTTDDFSLRERVCVFARRAFNLGVYVNQKSLYKNYKLGNATLAVKAFMWSSILSRRSEGVH